MRTDILGGGVRRLRSTMADGRELIYYDDADTELPTHRRPDERRLDPRPDTAEMRQDVLSGDWITVATTRQSRAFMPPPDQDPLAPQTSRNPSEIPSLYDVAVFENRSPSFGPALGGTGGHVLAADRPPFDRRAPAVGRCEVVAFSPEPQGSFASLSLTRARTVIEAWADRTQELSQLPGIEQVFIFENRGAEIGVTLPHPHGQIYAYPFVTPRTQRLLAAIDSAGDDIFEQILKRELHGPRLIFESAHWAAFVPFAARWPLEVHLVPKRHIPDFAATSLDERDELAHVYLSLLRAVDSLYATPTPYIAAWHQAPVHATNAARLHLQLTSPRRSADKLKYLAGSEAAMGAWVSDVSPEDAADRLRSAFNRQVPPGPSPVSVEARV